MLAAAILHAAAHGQAPSSPPAPGVPSVVDVVVQDPNGHPLHGLKPEDFRLTDSNVPQTLRNVEEHSSQSPTNPLPTLAPLPPGTFTNYTPPASAGALNILLLDALNTPAKDQHFIRHQLQQYVQQANPHTRIAIFGLANRLILLQGFTSDPATLRDVVERKLIARSPSALETGSETNRDPQPSAIEIAANLRQFESEMGAMETQFRTQYTLDAFNTLAHYLAAFPGRKNLLWFSGSFPLHLLPNSSLAHPSDTTGTDQEELRETLHLLSRAQVVLYPIAARGLITEPKSDAADHATADALASATGGRAFYSTNTLADAVTLAIDAGASYYSLTYTPTNPKADGTYHPIHVEIAGPDTAQRPQLFYRRGYYSTNTAQHPPTDPSANPSTTEDGRTDAYRQAAMSRGAPTPQDLAFEIRVLPASTTTDTAVAPNNQLSSSVPSNGPFRRYDLDFLALPAQLAFTQQPDGHLSAKLEFLAYVFDTEGRLLDATGTKASLTPRSTDYAKLAHSVIQCHLEVSVPDRVETFLRIGVRDLSTKKFGVVEIPTATVSNLPPTAETAETAPAKPETTPPAATPTQGRPSTPPRD
jgi:VWFA-related protein